MATVIDALIVTLGLDPANFAKGAAAAAKAQKKLSDQSGASAKDIEKQEKALAKAQADRAKDLEDRSKQIAAGLNKVRNEALGLLAVFTAGMGIKNFVTNTLDSASSLGFLAQNLDMSTERITAFQRANERAGGTAEAMTAQLKESADAVAKYKLGQALSPETQKFFELNGPPEAMKDAESYYKARADLVAQAYKNDPTKASVLASQMGINGTFDLTKKGAQAVDMLVVAQLKNSAVTSKDAAAALDLKNKMHDLADRLEYTATKVLLKLAPTLERLLNKLQEIADWVAAHQDDISAWVDKTVTAMVAFGKQLDSAAESAGGWKNILIALLALKVLSFAADMIALAGAIGKVGIALGGIAKMAWLLKPLGALGLLLHSSDLNSGEDQEVSKRNSDYRKNRPTPGQSGGGTRGMRNNNPGNIEYGKFAKEHGATGTDGRFATFPTMEAGQAAQQALLGGYLAHGTNTISSVIAKWAPNKENNTAAYVDAVSRRMGIGANQKLTSANIPALADAISRHENGAGWDKRNALAAVNMPSGAAASFRSSASNSTSSSEVKINQISVNTQATDAKGIAGAIGDAISNHGLVAQTNLGIS